MRVYKHKYQTYKHIHTHTYILKVGVGVPPVAAIGSQLTQTAIDIGGGFIGEQNLGISKFEKPHSGFIGETDREHSNIKCVMSPIKLPP